MLREKRADEVAYYLKNAFATQCILQNVNDQEFTNKIIEEVYGMWNELKIDHAKRRHNESQGSLERANQGFEKVFSNSLETNRTTKVSEGI